jgi:hypothetical protein
MTFGAWHRGSQLRMQLQHLRLGVYREVLELLFNHPRQLTHRQFPQRPHIKLIYIKDGVPKFEKHGIDSTTESSGDVFDKGRNQYS